MNTPLMIETRLNELLERKGKTLYWLSKETGTAYSTIHKLGHANTDAISFRVLEAICDALECQPGDLLVKVNGAARRKGGR